MRKREKKTDKESKKPTDEEERERDTNHRQ